jgi:CBS domain-containing protein
MSMQTTLDKVLRDKGDKVFTIQPGATVLEAVREMNQKRIGSLLVTDQDRVVGVFSERDVLCRIVDRERDPAATTVADVMTRELVVVKPSMTVEEAMSVCTEKRCRHLPVMENDRLEGVVSIGDLTRWLVRDQAYQIKDMVNYITGKYPV